MIRFTEEDALKYLEIIQKAAESLEDADAIQAPMLFERWTEDTTYKVGKRLCYGDKVYKVLQEHTSQANWTPDVAASLFADTTKNTF